MPDPPLYEAEAEAPSTPSAMERLVSVFLEDVDVGVDELWMQQFRYLGDARAKGAFRLDPMRHVWVGPASLELGSGQVVVGGEPALQRFSGRVDCTVSPFDVAPTNGLDVFH
jgi:hypothetical protein